MPKQKHTTRFILAPNTFKGSIDCIEAANALEKGIKKTFPSAEIIKCPIADGGEMTVQIIVNALNGHIKTAKVEDPLGRSIRAKFGLIDKGKTGVIEMCAASGMSLLKAKERNPLKTSTFGTGQLIKAVLDQGCRKIIIGVGGSATVDVGAGMLQALGVVFKGKKDKPLKKGGGNLETVKQINIQGLDPRLKECEVIVLCDVENKLLGKHGAAYVFGPQKGASPKDVKVLERNLKHFNKMTKKFLAKDMSKLKHGGAAGGITAALHTYLGARLMNGSEFLLDIIGMEAIMKKGGIVITAEGSFDTQTLGGKGPSGVAKMAGKHQLAVICIAGKVSKKLASRKLANFDAVISLVNEPLELDEALLNAKPLLMAAAFQVANLVKIGRVF